MASREENSWTDDMEDLFEDISFEEDQGQSEEDVNGDVADEMNDFLSGGQNEDNSGPLGHGMTKADYEDVVLDSAEAADDHLELIRRVHPDHAGSNELFRAHQRLKKAGLIEEHFKSTSETKASESTGESVDESYTISALPGFQNCEYQEALDIAPSPEIAQELVSYDGNVELARNVLETEWKIDNAAQYLSSEMFSEGSLACEAELILGELDEENRKETVQQLVESNQIYEKESENITTTWFQNDTLMGYDEEKGHNVRLDFYDDIREKTNSIEPGLTEMVEDAKEEIEDYELASFKAVSEVEGYVEDKELESYLTGQYSIC